MNVARKIQKVCIAHRHFLVGLLGIIILATVIRVYNLGRIPSGIYWEEAALGYDAYSILKTGKDHHGVSFPIHAFESFGDWKPSGYFYALLPSIAVFGLTEFAVRLPAALAGVSLVVGVAVLVLVQGRPFRMALFAALAMAISPWAFQFSRGGWEVMLATAALLWGIIFTRGWQKTGVIRWLVLGILFFSFSAYTYHSLRFIAPVLGLAFVGQQYFGEIKKILSAKNKEYRVKITQLTVPLVIIGIIAVLINSPWLLAFKTGEASKRLAETSTFSDLTLIQESNQQREYAQNSTESRIFAHRFILESGAFLENILSHFDIEFLFSTGDSNWRHSTKQFGIFYPLDALLLIAGIWAIWNQPKQRWLLVWIGITLVPIGLTKATPHALRLLPAIPAAIYSIAEGAEWLISYVEQIKGKKRMMAASAACLYGAVYLFQFFFFWHHYIDVYPTQSSRFWQTGYRALFPKLAEYQKAYPDLAVYMDHAEGRPIMYYWFYNQIDPAFAQAEQGVRSDQGERLVYDRDNIRVGLPKADSFSEEQAIVALFIGKKNDFETHSGLVWKDAQVIGGWKVGVVGRQ